MNPDREQQLLERIRELEELNSALQDKLDLIYEIVAPPDESTDHPDGEVAGPAALVSIDLPKN